MKSLPLLVLAALIAVPAASRAELLTFDGLTVNGIDNNSYVPVPNGYGGLTYNQFYLFNTTIGNSAFQPAFPVSSPEVIYNNFNENASISAAGGFTLNSLYLAGRDSSDSVTLTASLLGGGTDTATFIVSNIAPSFEALNWAGVTSVAFTTPLAGEYFSVDNLTVNATPEPSSLILLGTGILSAAGAARRKLRKA